MRFLAFLGPVLLLGCTLPLRATLEKVVEDYQAPKPTCDFEDGSGIADTTPLVITFTKSIDTATLVLGGAMAAESDGGTWSESESANDTLTVQPKTRWTMGSNRTLTVDCADGEGFTAIELSLAYGVLDGSVYVHGTAGSDDNPGTADLPKKSIGTGVATAARVYATSTVRVAEGNYTPTDVIVLPDGISLEGGYKADDWGTQETDVDWAITGDCASAYPTVIKTSSTTAAIMITGTTAAQRIFGFTINGGFGGTGESTTGIACESSSRVVIEGNSIDGGGGYDLSIGISLDASSVTVQRNKIYGGSGSGCAAVLCSQGSPLVTKNVITGGETSESDSFTVGVYCDGSSLTLSYNMISAGSAYATSIGVSATAGSDAVIFNNVIDGGSTLYGLGTTGVVITASDPVLRNNTICAGVAGYHDDPYGEEGISMTSASHAVIQNNLVFTLAPSTGSPYRYGVTASSDSQPASFKNNYVFACAGGAFAWASGSAGTYPAESNVNSTAICADVGGNTADTGDGGLATTFIQLASPSNWRLAGSAQAAALTGGLDGSALGWGFSDDLDGSARTPAWSIGAYEH